MKTYSKIIFAAFAAAFGLASCAQEELAPAEKPQGSLVTVHFGAESQIATTKATLTTDDEQTFKSAWEADDRISVYYLNGADDKGNTVKATWNGQAFSAQLPDYTGTWLYQACFPVPDEKDSHVDFGGARTQKGNSYNSSYDIMVGSADADNAAAGKDDNGNDIVFKMTRQTAIQYFHLKTADFDEAVTKATLTVEGGSIAAQYAYVSDFTFAPTADLKEIEVTFPESAPKASDFSVWFNVLPTATEGNSAVTKMTLTVETASKTLTVTNTKGATYEAGKLYKVVREIPASDWVSKDTPEPEIPVYASLSELVAAGKPSSTATNVTVTLKDEVIKTFNGTKGVNLLVGSQAIQIYCKGAAFPTEWVEGGTISGTLTNCEWVLYGGNTWELCPEDWDELTYTAPTAPIEVPVYASLSELVAAGAPTEAGAQVTVTLKDEEITKFYKTSKGYTNGVYLNVDGQEIEIFCRDVPSAWEIGGLLSGTLTKCDWKIYRGTWELCPENWDELTYTAPLASCETPVITLDGAVATITCATDGATIHYTVGESPAGPTESDAVYSSPVTLTDGQTIKARAVKDGMKPSAVAVKKYTLGGVSWSRVTTVSELLKGGVFIIGYEKTANSGQIIPMLNSGTATTSKAGYMNANSKAIDMTTVSETASYEVTISESKSVSGAITIKCGDYYLGNTDTRNNCKLFASESESTSFTPTIKENDVFTLKITSNKTYHILQYNTSNPRFAVYKDTQEDVVIYKKNN